MRFILIDASNRKVFDMMTPHRIDENFIARTLRRDCVERVELADDLDLWVSSEPVRDRFRFFSDGPEYVGSGMLTGRTWLGDFKSLPRWLTYEAINGWVAWPRCYEAPQARRKIQRPTGLPLIGRSLDPYHRILPESARENPYLMQMYG
ncbi:hypothetical protein MesoLj131c_62350 [Mesorhizobium sp. 131-3-5]|uniref:hypothetical protein n=1 Tax=Mesorhizobium sp. 131-3-5 TaxID=2744520 RepID=UPI001927B379|nr:hypothetical protein [Mesorhizobium sp. 131-3-5]BCH11977.1 hypothetical protein MesoLj131c_62350 [Mesorhizobium sp. 131-3-5]